MLPEPPEPPEAQSEEEEYVETAGNQSPLGVDRPSTLPSLPVSSQSTPRRALFQSPLGDSGGNIELAPPPLPPREISQGEREAATVATTLGAAAALGMPALGLIGDGGRNYW